MAKAAKTPMKAGGGTPGPKTPKMKPQHTPKGKPHTPGMKNGTPGKFSPKKTPKKTPKPQPDTPMPPKQTPKTAPPTPKAQQTPKVQQTPKAQQQTPKPKQKTQQQQKQIHPPLPKLQQKSPKAQQNKVVGPDSKPARDTQARTVRLTFPAGSLKSVEQVKKFVPTATSVKFPNVVFVEFGSEAEADKQHAKLQPLIADGQLHQVSFVGQKEREFQSNNRTLDNTRLFVRGIGNATEADIKKLFPTATDVAIRGSNMQRGHRQAHKFCFIVFATAAACTEALEKSKGLTLFGNPLTVNYAFLRKDDQAKAEKRPAEAEAAQVTKKAKVEAKEEAAAPAAKKAKGEANQEAAVAAALAAKKVMTEMKEEEDEDEDDEMDDEEEEGDEEEDEDEEGEEEEDDDDEEDDDEGDDEEDGEEDDDDDEEGDDDDDDDDEEEDE